MRIKKYLAAVPAVCLLLASGAIQAGAADLTKLTSGAVVEVFNKNNNQEATVYNCSSVAEAWSKAASGAGSDYETVITLGSDWVEEELLSIGKNKRITLDLNGHFIKRDINKPNNPITMIRNGEVFHVDEGASFTIRDSDPRIKGYDGLRGGVITGGSSSNTGGGIHVEENGKLRMEGGTIYKCITSDDGGAVYLDGSSDSTSFQMTGGRIYACMAYNSGVNCYGGAIYLHRGTVEISNAKIDDCYSEDYGGAIYSERGNITLNKVIFSGNKARNNGGAIYTALDTAKNIATQILAYDCIFAGNQTEDNGGAVFINDNPDQGRAILFHNCVFRSNYAQDDGGAVHITDDNIVLSSCEITGNRAGRYGGGVFVDSRYNLTLKGRMIVESNHSDKDKAYDNMTLETGTSSKARIINGGLYRNSNVYIGTTSGSTQLVSEYMSQYQTQYFHEDTGRLTQKDLREFETQMVTTASIFSNGGFYAAAILGGAGVAGAAALIIHQKKKKKASEGGEEND